MGIRKLKYYLLIGVVMAIAVTATAVAAGDTTAPVVSSVTPADGSTVFTNGDSTRYYNNGSKTAAPYVIKADYSDEVGGSGVDASSVMVHLDGTGIGDGFMLMDCPVQSTTHVECNAPAALMSAGTHTLHVYVWDVAGNKTVNGSTFTVVVDILAPTYSNLSPADGSTIYTSHLNSASTNDSSALRFDYDIADADPSSGWSPMNHINDSFPPGGGMGAMIAGSSCTKTPTTNPTHYSCQANRASLLHLGDNTLSVLIKDNVNNQSSDYGATPGAPDTRKHYTVVDDVAPAVSGVTADATTISASYTDPLPTGALSANLASGINAASVMVHVDGMMVGGCTATATGVSCPTPAGIKYGPHLVEVFVDDNASTANHGSGSGTFTFTTCTPARPDLSVATKYAYWADFASYHNGVLSVKLTITNNSSTAANNVTLTGASGITNGVTQGASGWGADLGTINGGSNTVTSVAFSVGPEGSQPAGFKATISASAVDDSGAHYTYPI